MLTAGVKAASAAKVIAGGRLFGAGDALDAYLIAFLIPSFLGDVFAGALNPALIPAFIETREREGRAAAVTVYATALYRSVVFFCVAAALAFACSDPLLRLLGSGFAPAKLALSRSLLGYMIGILPLSAVSVIWRSMLNAHDRFAVAAAAPVLTPLVTIAVVVSAAGSAGVTALAAGTALGAIVEVTVLALSLRRLGFPVFPRWSWNRTAGLFEQYRPIAITNAVLGGSLIVDQAMAAMLGSGSVSLLNFGTRVPGVLLAVGPAALSTALFPRLSVMSARSDWSGLRKLLTTYLCLSAAVTVPVALALASFSLPVARVVFQRGAFTPEDTRAVAAVQAISFLQLPLAVMLALLVRAVASLRANRLLVGTAAIAIVVNAALNYALMRPMGVAGIALSTTVVYALSLALAGAIVFRRLREKVQLDRGHGSD